MDCRYVAFSEPILMGPTAIHELLRSESLTKSDYLTEMTT